MQKIKQYYILLKFMPREDLNRKCKMVHRLYGKTCKKLRQDCRDKDLTGPLSRMRKEFLVRLLVDNRHKPSKRRKKLKGQTSSLAKLGDQSKKKSNKKNKNNARKKPPPKQRPPKGTGRVSSLTNL